MERREFLRNIGSSAAFVLTVSCLGSCSSNPTAAGGPVDFTIDLTKPQYVSLNVTGSFVVTNNCVVAHGIDGRYYAATVICTHQQNRNVQYDAQNNDFRCTVHGSRFTLTGAVQNSPATVPLTIYTTELNGSFLRVHS